VGDSKLGVPSHGHR